jgi:hypothetical protein
MVAITANRTVNKAGADAVVVGRLIKASKEADESGTVETRFKELIEVKADGAIAAGDVVKMSSADGSGVQRVTKWVSQTDAVPGDRPQTAIGICWNGGADGTTVEVLAY